MVGWPSRHDTSWQTTPRLAEKLPHQNQTNQPRQTTKRNRRNEPWRRQCRASRTSSRRSREVRALPSPPRAGCWLTGADLSAVVEARQRLDSQLQENKSVQKVQTPRAYVYLFILPFIGERGGGGGGFKGHIAKECAGILGPKRRHQYLQTHRPGPCQAGPG